MHSARKLGFCSRPSGEGPIFVWDFQFGPRLPQPKVADAKRVTLRMRDERVLVRFVQRLADGLFVGEVYGFAQTKNLEFESIRFEDRILFNEEHVFGASN